ncbi:hypothetical protein PINS_up007408 [Pythium insidiosum]|nr:hypothetical protein PINS_up007408 [Pythium insidiosum]
MKTLTALLASSLALYGAVAASEPRLNGWYPCAETDDGSSGAPNGTLASLAKFECAELEVPLCYEGVCKSDDTIELFVRRRLAQKKAADGQPRALFRVPGGPGQTSVVEEGWMLMYAESLGDTVDMYTVDHRGTGRSEFLECEASQAMTGGSPSGTEISNEEMVNCIKDLRAKYDGNAAAFSVTSAARDIQTVIETFMPKHKVFVNGASYGTFLTQRLMQFKLPQVVGYIYDGVDALTTKKDPIESAVSHWNEAILASSKRLLEYCFDSKDCPIKFKSRDTVVKEVVDLFDSLDDEKSECGDFLAELLETEKPSVAIRSWLGGLVSKTDQRNTALAVVSHLQTCTEDDQAKIKELYGDNDSETIDAGATPDRLKVDSALLYNVVVYSERWAQPAPTKSQLDKFFHDCPFPSGSMDGQQLSFCQFNGFKDPACADFKTENVSSSDEGFQYEHDKYFEEPVVLPDHASALIINGGLDFATPLEFGELLYHKLRDTGRGAMVVNFDYGNHCGGEAVDMESGTPCRDGIVTSFIAQDGALDKVNTNCMAELPTATFA